jgi:nitrile hydratase
VGSTKHTGDDETHNEHAHNTYSDSQARVLALESLLAAKGLIDPAAIDAIIQAYETKIGPHNGARVVARAWQDPAFAEWLKTDASAAIACAGLGELKGTRTRAVFNTEHLHNLVVCTLCSCYPWALLGLPPEWYKAPAYRARAVIDPRAVLREFGLELPQTTQIRVWDSTAELRYLVVPERPMGSDDMTEDELMRLVPRDSMIGAGIAISPASLK